MKIRIKAPEGSKLRDIRTGALHSEVVTDEKNRKFYEVVRNTTDIETINMSNIHTL